MRLGEAGRYRVWVRYMQVAAWRGPFQVAVATAQKTLAAKTFDLKLVSGIADWEYHWQSLDADLPAGEVTLSLAKHEQKNCVGYVRHIDCLLLTTDDNLVPDHLPYGPQTLVRVTIGDGYVRPVYMHLFADHYRSPRYSHYAMGQDGIHQALRPPSNEMLNSGDVTPWCNLTPTIYQDSGAALNLSVRHSYHGKATRFRAKLEFGRVRAAGSVTAAESRNDSATTDDVEVVRTFDVDATPNGLVIIAPPDLDTPQHIALLKRDAQFADEIGKRADAFAWPAHGRRPQKIPFLASASIGGYELPVDDAVTQREQKTLDYFGFNGAYDRILHGLWYAKDNSYCRPDLEKMQQRAQHDLDQFKKSGRQLDDIAACMLMDEPTGQTAAFAAKDEGYRQRFREWLKSKSLTPQDLLLTSWNEVRPVIEGDRAQFPALHYYTQLFRTRALGDFMAAQREIIETTYGQSFPTLVNFSDGAVYHANFCGQGVDYFELLDDDRQNAIWGEDWANNSSTYQCGAFNVALMQAAARKRGQSIGHYLIAHAGRTPWDIKTKAVAETARGVRMWMNFSYGPNWSSHEGGPAWRSHLWHGKPELWKANAEITREIGAAEDWLLTAQPAKAEVALLYSSSSDIWTMQSNLAYGFDRMHTWLALTHAQIPVDIVPEREFDRLDHYKVCYLSGPNLTRSAAAKLRTWVKAGGMLWLTADAASHDEFNRAVDTIASLLPVRLGEPATLDAFHSAGRFLSYLNPRDTVTWDGEVLEVLSVKQPLSVVGDAEVLATFADGQPAVAVGKAGKGRVVVSGFLPALSYIKPALVSRRPLEQQVEAEREAAAKLAAANQASGRNDQPLATSATVSVANASSKVPTADREVLERSYNPWVFSEGIREKLLTPVRAAKVALPLTCDTPLVDAVALPCEQGTLIALANHTLRPLDRVKLQLRTEKPVTRVESVRQGLLKIEPGEAGVIRFVLPLDASDFVMVSHEGSASALTSPNDRGTKHLPVGTLPIGKVLFLGNSITLHGPSPNIGRRRSSLLALPVP